MGLGNFKVNTKSTEVLFSFDTATESCLANKISFSLPSLIVSYFSNCIIRLIMLKKCFISECSDQVIGECPCMSTATYFCTAHAGGHLLTAGPHNFTSTQTSVFPPSIPNLLSRAKAAILYINARKEKIITHTNRLLEQLLKYSQDAFKDLSELEKNLTDFYKNLVSAKEVDKDQYSYVKSLIIPEEITIFKDVSMNIFAAPLFSFLDDLDCNEIIFSKDSSRGKVLAIDLEHFKKFQLEYILPSYIYGQVCKISKSQYFYYGGYKAPDGSGEVLVVDVEERKCEKFPSGLIRWNGGSTYKDQKVFVFGGSNADDFMSSCQAFCLATKLWQTLPNLPFPLAHVTVSQSDDLIILTGYNTNKLLAYMDNEFSEILSLHNNSYKVLCTNWLVTSSTLYENNGITWNSYHVAWNPTGLLSYTTCPRGKFIYFISDTRKLWRINKDLKILEIIKYS